MNGYGASARDSSRISDMTNIEKALRFHAAQFWGYPAPDNNQWISYSWWLVWTQWVFWDDLVVKLQRINKKPVDPLTKNEYAYSVLNSNTEFQIAWMLESNIVYSPTNVRSAYADSRVWKAYVTGDYNGKIAKTSMWATTYILAVPTIISWDMWLLDLLTLVQNKKLVYNKQPAKPASYVWTEFSATAEFDFTPSGLVVFEGDEDELSDLSTQTQFLEKLQEAYSWTIVTEIDNELYDLVNLELNTLDPSDAAKKMSHSLLKSSVSSDIPSYVWKTNPPPIVSWPCGLTAWDVATLNDFFDYPGSPYQHATEQEWCDETAINAYAKSISKELPSVIGKLENLESLEVHGNDITGTIDPSIWTLASLERLNLNDNDMTGTIPASLWALTSLETLWLKNNDFTWTIPEGFDALSSLVWLDLAGNNLSWGLPLNIGNLSNLENVYLHNNDFSQLPDSLASLTNLKLLSLYGNSQLWGLSSYISPSSSTRTQANITETWAQMTISGNGTTIDVSVN